MDVESTKIFNDRLAQWVAKQGFWFQLRYSMAGGGATVLMYHFMRLMLKVAIFFVILAALAIAYLVKRTDQQAFDVQLKDAIVAWLGADSGKMRSFDRIQNKATIRYLSLDGGMQSLFDRCEATGITFRMGLMDGIFGTWNANQISVDRLSLSVKAGAESAEEADALAATIAKKFEKLSFQAFECKNTRISWGYSARTMGQIDQSRLTALRDDQGWQLRFQGGTFSQNWLRNLEINELTLRLTEGELIVEKGDFTVSRDADAIAVEGQQGRVYFQSVVVKGGLRPAVSGKITLENVPLAPLLQQSYQAFVEGVVSGQLDIGGSTNTTDGITLAGRISLQEGDGIYLRNRIPLLSSLSILSPSGSYRKVNLTQGSFQIRTGGGKMTIDEMQLLAVGQMEIKGNLIARPATAEEIDDMLNKKAISSDLAESVSDQIALQGGDEMTIGKAAELLGGPDQAAMGFEGKIVDASLPFQAELNEKEMQLQLSEKLALTAFYEGQLYLTMPVAAFPTDALTVKKLPRAVDSPVIFLECPLRGNLNQLTLAQAESLMIVESTSQAPKPSAQAPKPSVPPSEEPK
jgi:hypothetical protein